MFVRELLSLVSEADDSFRVNRASAPLVSGDVPQTDVAQGQTQQHWGLASVGTEKLVCGVT